jgi:hypothetical protein
LGGITLKRLFVLLALGLVAALAAAPAYADSPGQEVAYGAGSVFGTLLYAPLKTSFCVLGAVTSGLALPFSGPQGSGRMATAACAGTWAITPAVLKGQERLRFIGEPQPTTSESQPTTSEPRSTTAEPRPTAAEPRSPIKDWRDVDDNSSSASPR